MKKHIISNTNYLGVINLFDEEIWHGTYKEILSAADLKYFEQFTKGYQIERYILFVELFSSIAKDWEIMNKRNVGVSNQMLKSKL